eukprot:6377026-Amphidinium_carterae.1
MASWALHAVHHHHLHGGESRARRLAVRCVLAETSANQATQQATFDRERKFTSIWPLNAE